MPELPRDADPAEPAQIQYTAKADKINQLNPGVFFYYATVEAPALGTWTIKNPQLTTARRRRGGRSHDKGQIILYTSGCVRVQAAVTMYANGTSTITVASGGYTPGATYIYSVKYDPNTLVGQLVSANQNVTYSFWTVNQGVTDFGSFDAIKFMLKK